MGRRNLGRGAALCVALGALASLAWASAASADGEFCPPGAGAGQCGAPANLSSLRGLSVDRESGHLYVADQANNRLDVFDNEDKFLYAIGWGVDTGAGVLEKCTEASGCQIGLAGSGLGQLKTPSKVAVDNDPASPSFHDVYVVDSNFRVQKFKPSGEVACSIGSEGETEGKFQAKISIAVGPGGVLYVLDNLEVGDKHRLQRFKPSCAPVEAFAPQCILFEGGRARSLAVDSGGNAWVANEGVGRGIRKYDPSCALLFAAEGSEEIENIELALDGSDNLFAAQGEGPYRVITAYSPAGALKRRFGYDRIPTRPEGLAIRETDKAGILVSIGKAGTNEAGIKRLEFAPLTPTLPPPGPIAAPSSVKAIQVGSAKATAAAEINPEGKETQVHFEYLSQADYEAQGNSFIGLATKETTPKPLGASGFNLKAFEGVFGCPDPASEAGTLGNGCLVPETTYRWRVVATNLDGKGEGTIEGPPVTTKPAPEFGEIYATGVRTDTARLHGEVDPTGIPTTGWFEYVDEAAYLKDIEEGGDGFAAARKAPDIDAGASPLSFGSGEGLSTRAATISPLAPGTAYRYRLLADTPLTEPVIGEEVGALRTFAPATSPPCANDAFRIGPGALLPDCRAYEMVSPIDKAGGDVQVLIDGLGSREVLEQSSDTGEKLAYGSLRAFGDAASAPLTSQYIAQRIAGKEWATHSIDSPRGEPIVGAVTQQETEFKAFSPDLCETWQATFAEPPLAAGALPGYSNLYRRGDQLCGEDGEAHYEALAPGSAPQGVPGNSFLIAFQGASADGTHAIFMAPGKLSAEASTANQLYESTGGAPPRLVCHLPGGEAMTGACTAGSSLSTFNIRRMSLQGAISADGERIFFSAPGTGEGKIYVRIGGTQTLEVSKGGEEEAGTAASWFWGAAENGSRAIFSTGDLSGGKATLYEYELEGKATQPLATGVLGVMGMSDDATRIYFVSRKALAAGAVEGKANLYLREAGGSTRFIAALADADLIQGVALEPRDRTSRVSPDGLHAAFGSVASLTGYDNRAASDAAPTREIYQYGAASKELICASCNPTGARPAGQASMPAFETGMHAARTLSDDGSRLYFESADTLAARDSNGAVDVYQWERLGTGGCKEDAAGFSAAAAGCIELISSGQGPQDSRFTEADPSGKNVFFATVSSLLPQDPGVFDIYDARAGGGLPVPAPPGPICEADACHIQVPTPEEPTPASSEYVPPATQGKPKPRCAKGKRRVSRKGKARCVPRARHKGRQRRAGR